MFRSQVYLTPIYEQFRDYIFYTKANLCYKYNFKYNTKSKFLISFIPTKYLIALFLLSRLVLLLKILINIKKMLDYNAVSHMIIIIKKYFTFERDNYNV
jgi:hypothetical protein